MSALTWFKWAALAGVFIGWSWVCYHQGGLGCRLSSANATAKQEATQIKQETSDAATINAEAKAFEDHALDPVPAPVVRMCIPAAGAAVREPAAAGPGAHAAAAVPAARAPDLVPGPDIGRPSLQVDHDADLQVSLLQDYITKVCLHP